jgi:hypothetical protein
MAQGRYDWYPLRITRELMRASAPPTTLAIISHSTLNAGVAQPHVGGRTAFVLARPGSGLGRPNVEARLRALCPPRGHATPYRGAPRLFPEIASHRPALGRWHTQRKPPLLLWKSRHPADRRPPAGLVGTPDGPLRSASGRPQVETGTLEHLQQLQPATSRNRYAQACKNLVDAHLPT